jgi:hypothetical protein
MEICAYVAADTVLGSGNLQRLLGSSGTLGKKGTVLLNIYAFEVKMAPVTN